MVMAVSTKQFLLAIITLCFFMAASQAQNSQKSPLEREVTLSFNFDKADGALRKIEQQAQINFSYNPSIFDLKKDITAQFENKSVREILNSLFPGQLEFKEKGNYVILTKSQLAKNESKQPPLIITGYVIDSDSGLKIGAVSIYDKRTLSAAITNRYGYFKIEINKPEDFSELTISKKGYADKTITVSKNSEEFLTISIDSEITGIDPVTQLPPDEPETSSALRDVVKPVAMTEREINMTNIKDTLYRKFQVSVFPFVGTNGALSGNVVNEYSLNIFGGYSMGTSKFEVGGYFNINRAYMHGTQLAGFLNYVGGDASGFQAAGFTNIVRGESHAWQMAGSTNVNFDSASKPQFAGLLNTNLNNSKSLHMAGLANFHSGYYDGVAISGLLNANFKKSKGTLAAGMANFQIGDYHGFQVSGLTNLNFGRMEGVQLTSLLNISGNLRGSQIGLVNIADSVSGVQIGFISFSRAGYHKIEISADEIFYANLALRTGSSNAFYNIFTAGIKPQSGEPYWTYGYGVGSSPRLAKWLYLNTDLTAHQVSKGNPVDEFHLLSKFYLGLEFQVARKFSITGAATLNSYLTKNTYTDYPYLFTDYTPKIILEENYSSADLNHQMWMGWKFGLRFL
jgi:hypothetical protein